MAFSCYQFFNNSRSYLKIATIRRKKMIFNSIKLNNNMHTWILLIVDPFFNLG
ncbi:hypothetical protein HanXRQr2_Chr12g0537651 [Helianthus annuus]|uniref:Uncharacterized protein n=1 Tax=Helianthus annuus TaxID=4232 RepID=A0A9K3MVN0_HELAN|nr:hypothetical protein HanXRQr2_Chr12g0537651 [Helianthus annuus]